MKALGPTRVLRAAALFSAFIAASPIRAFEPIADTGGFGDLARCAHHCGRRRTGPEPVVERGRIWAIPFGHVARNV
jgi:hypothetical protein